MPQGAADDPVPRILFAFGDCFQVGFSEAFSPEVRTKEQKALMCV